MTIEEKREYIEKYCHSRADCPGCPIFKFQDEGCFLEETTSDEKVERNYKALKDYEGSNMKTNNDLSRNGSGYSDPTAAKAIKNITEKEKRVSKVIKTIKSIAELAGYEIEERIVLKDKTSGEIWR